MDDLKDYIFQEFLLIPQREEFVSGESITLSYNIPLIIPEKPLIKLVSIHFVTYLFNKNPSIKIELDLENYLKNHIGLRTTKKLTFNAVSFTLPEIGKSNSYKKPEYDNILKNLYILTKNNNYIIQIINDELKSQILDNAIMLSEQMNNLSHLTDCDLEEYYSIIRNELK